MFWLCKPEGKQQLWRSSHRWEEDFLKFIIQKEMRTCVMVSLDSGWGLSVWTQALWTQHRTCRFQEGTVPDELNDLSFWRRTLGLWGDLCSHNKGKDKGGRVHVMKACRGSIGIAPPILKRGMPRPLYSQYPWTGGWVGHRDCLVILETKKKFLASVEIRTPDHSARKPRPHTDNAGPAPMSSHNMTH